MTDVDGQLSVTDVARLAEVGVTAVSNWRSRHATFPTARRSGDAELFAAREVAAWLGGRKIATNDLKADESIGATYGERFLRNIGAPDDESGSIEQTPGAAESDNARRLWSALDRLRGSYDIESYAELVLGLLCLRVRDPVQWERVVGESRAGAPAGTLRQVSLSVGVMPPIRLLRNPPREFDDERALHELVRVVEQLDFSGSRDVGTKAARLLVGLLGHMAATKGKRGDHDTPASLVRVMVELTDPGPQDRVYDPFCRSGELLVGAAVHARRRGTEGDGISLTGDAASEHFRHMTWLSAALLGVDVDLGHRLSLAVKDDRQLDREFDVILTNPPFNMSRWAPHDGTDDRHWRYGAPPRHNANFAWLQHVTAAMAPGGRAAVLMPNVTATSENPAEAHIRARMVDAGVVESVVALPSRLFTSTGIPVSLWLLRAPDGAASPDILVIDATHLGAVRDRVHRALTDDDVQRIIREYRS